MSTATHVLVGVDGSEPSRRAFDVALSIAQKRGWGLRLVSTYSTPLDSYAYKPSVATELRRAVGQQAERTVAALADEASAAGLEVSTRVEAGNPSGLLIAESATAALAVVGKRGRNRFAGRFLGSVSLSLTAHAQCPTLVVPEKWSGQGPDGLFAPAQERPADAAGEPMRLVADSGPTLERRDFENVEQVHNYDQQIMVGVDLGQSAEHIARTAAAYAVAFDWPLTLVSATNLPTEMYGEPDESRHTQVPAIERFTNHLKQLAESVRAEHPGLTVEWKFFDGSPAGVLSEATRTAPVVVIGTRGHGGFVGMLLGSVSQSVLTRTVAPVLVIPSSHTRTSS